MKWFHSFCISIVLIVLTGCQSIESESDTQSDGEWNFDWDRVETRIIELTNQALRDESPSELYRLKSQLVRIFTGISDQRTASRDYWTAVLNTNLMLVEQERGEDSQVHRLIDESIDLLERTDFSKVETNALLAILYRTKIDYDERQTFDLFKKMQDALDIAIEIDPTNLRVLLAQIFIGSSPILGFSLELNVDESIDLALSSTFESPGDALTPSWGLPEIYSLAIGHLMEAEKLNEASELVSKGIARFPDDAMLSYYASLFQIDHDSDEE